MKQVLIPVDFSNSAVNALLYGIEMANQLKANVRIMHVITGDHYSPAFAKDQVAMKINENAEVWLQELIKEHGYKHKVIDGTIDYKIREGNVVNEIANQAKYDDTSLIVIGSHGASGFQAKFIGSNAYRLVSHSPCPVIVVNEKMEVNPDIKRIVVPLDYSKASRRKIPAVTGLAKLFKAEVNIVGLKESNLDFIIKRIGLVNRQVERFIRANAEVEVTVDTITGNHLAEQLIEFSRKVDADLISLHIHHSTNPFTNWFKPFSNDVINNSDKPVLVIPTKE